MLKATCKLARLGLKQSESDFEIVHRAVIKHRTADALAGFTTKNEDKTPLDDDAPVFTLLKRFLADAPLTGKSD